MGMLFYSGYQFGFHLLEEENTSGPYKNSHWVFNLNLIERYKTPVK